MEIRVKDINYSNYLKNINYTFKEGTITSIVGKSGSGKSLLGFVLMDIIRNYDGEVLVNGNDDYDKYDYLRKVGYVFQNPEKHFITRTVREEISFGLKQYNYKKEKIDERVLSSIKVLGLSNDILDKNLINLSAGEMVKVALASSLVMDPQVLILDNITVYLDNRSKNNLLKLLLKLNNKYNMTIIIITRDMDFVYEIGNDYIFMNNGEISSFGSVNDIKIDDRMFREYGMDVPKILNIVNDINVKKDVALTNVRSIKDLVVEVEKNND